MVYFDIRPSAHLPTVELRVCDACPDVEDVVLIAGLFRALVGRARAEPRRGPPAARTTATSCCARAAGVRRARGWRATSSTSAGSAAGRARSCSIGRLVDSLRPHLEELGDWEQVLALSEAALTTGSAAARQRRTFGRAAS